MNADVASDKEIIYLLLAALTLASYQLAEISGGDPSEILEALQIQASLSIEEMGEEKYKEGVEKLSDYIRTSGQVEK
jgi:hypothetical protein